MKKDMMMTSLPAIAAGLSIRKNILVTLSAVSVFSLALAFSAPASAGGVLGDLLEGACGGCGVGRALDQAHAAAGNPLDHAGAAIVQNYGVPVSPHCATTAGIFVGRWLPIGFPCNVNGRQGIIVN